MKWSDFSMIGVMKMDYENQACPWVGHDPLYRQYHDTEWGIPLHDDQRLFELIVLEGMQAGLSWLTILRKRENFRQAFDYFDPEQVALYDDDRVAALLQDSGIIRNRLKIRAAIQNAGAFLKVKQEFGSFDRYLWSWVNDRPIINQWQAISGIPARSGLSDQLSQDLIRRGFKFVGSTICYALMQSAGLVWDHLTSCPCQPEAISREETI
jgi:DNA-3-methyladenine glycosylase I